ncbi:hypothetical protein [Streptomyces nogalater]|uniref:hypothetical protein n=1 Tax=Streptomyces nogalater TaxID=38314 RepID=UPI0031D5BD47
MPEPLLAEARSIAASHHAEHGEPITAVQPKRRLGIGLPMATALHAALHTCASLLPEQGADAHTIMEALGHSSMRVTMDIYTFVRLYSQRSAFD